MNNNENTKRTIIALTIKFLLAILAVGLLAFVLYLYVAPV